MPTALVIENGEKNTFVFESVSFNTANVNSAIASLKSLGAALLSVLLKFFYCNIVIIFTKIIFNRLPYSKN